MIEDAETAEAAREAKLPEPPTSTAAPTRNKPVRAALPESLPREEIVYASGFPRGEGCCLLLKIYAASFCARSLAQAQGRSSSMRLILWSAMRARTSRR
jgi:hypothetical protein